MAKRILQILAVVIASSIATVQQVSWYLKGYYTNASCTAVLASAFWSILIVGSAILLSGIWKKQN